MLDQKTKEFIKKRDGKCKICGGVEDLTIDHKIPLMLGGTDDENNLETLCKTCNHRKGPVPNFWQRIVNLLNGNFYWFKYDILNKYSLLRGNLFADVKRIEANVNGLQSANDTKFANQGQINAAFNQKLSSLQQREAILSERIIGLEKFHKIEWQESKEYKKIKVNRKKP